MSLPTCQRCQYYKVTWDQKQPHGCLLFSFKSHHLPAVEVQQSTGLACPQFRLSARHNATRNFSDALHLETEYLLPRYSKDGELVLEQSLETGEASLFQNHEPQSRPEDGLKVNPKANSKANSKTNLGHVLGKKGILH